MSSKFFKRSSCRAARLLAASLRERCGLRVDGVAAACADVYTWTLSPSQTGRLVRSHELGGLFRPAATMHGSSTAGRPRSVRQAQPVSRSTSAPPRAVVLQITTGRLSASQQYVGYSGTGSVMQSGGANTTSYLTLAQ